MKKWRLGCAAACIGLLFLVSACNIASTNDSSSEKVLKAGATGQSFPNAYKGEDGILTGFDVEVTELIAERLGYTVNWVNTDFSGLMGQLDSQKIDTVANAVAETAERAKKLNFTSPYSYYGAQLVAGKQNSAINSIDDFKGKEIGGVLGSNHVATLKNHDKNGDIAIRTYETRDGAIQDVVKGNLDGYINSRPVILAEIKRSKLPFKLVGDPMAYEKVGFPFVKNARGDRLREEFEGELKKLREEGKLAQLSEKYFGEDITLAQKGSQ